MLPLNCAEAVEKAPMASASAKAARIRLHFIPTSPNKKVLSVVSPVKVSCLRSRKRYLDSASFLPDTSRRTLSSRKEDAQWVMCTNGGWPAGEKPRSQRRDLGHPLVGRRSGLRTGDHLRRNAQTPTDRAQQGFGPGLGRGCAVHRIRYLPVDRRCTMVRSGTRLVAHASEAMTRYAEKRQKLVGGRSRDNVFSSPADHSFRM